jgi:hypothetical protein
VLFSLLLAGCGGSNHVGDACNANKDCSSKLCLPDPFPGGYCTEDCTSKPCGPGEVCNVVGVIEVCLKACTAVTDCRAGYQCFMGGCQPNCGTDDDCGKGYVCTSGTCTVKPGDPLGAACMVDDDCSSQTCFQGKCQQGCARDADCMSTQTCYYNPFGDVKATPTTQIVPICITARGGAALGAACTKDTDCDHGSCQLGMCVEMCATGGDCTRTGTGCADLAIQLDNKTMPALKSCLPTSAVIDFDGTSGKVPLPSTAQSFAIYSHVEPFDFTLAVGITQLLDPTGTAIYTQPTNATDFAALAVRYIPTEASSTMLVPNSPRVTLMPGVYRFSAATSGNPVPTVRVYMKLHGGALTSGTVPLNIYYTDLSGACRPTTFNQLQSGAISSALNTLTRIYQQVGISFTGPNYFDVSQAVGTSTIRVSTSTDPTMQLPDLDMMLQAATTGTSATVGLDVVLLRSITDQNNMQSGVLGVAGGIPTNPVLGTPHSGVVVSMDTLCFGGQSTFGSTIGHELGHSIGLFHNVEQDGSTDPLTDTKSDGQNNLMYWVEDSGQHLSTEQGNVMRNDPKVQP